MKTAIIYCSKYGTTEKICQTIGSQLSEETEVTLYNLKEQVPVILDDYSVVILGTPIYASKPRKEMVSFCSRNEEALLRKRLFLFVCGMDKEHAIEEIEKSYSPQLISHAVDTVFFTGEYLLDKMKYGDRLLLRMFFKVKESQLNNYTNDVKIITDKIKTK
ncbi:MAG: flavodoxin domain-containing protein [Bacteroidales bacterium]|nr:flavodoxin domain-containing protein [Bacteroidales bacterium]